MRLIFKIFILPFLFILLSPAEADAQQEEMFKEKKERKRVWRRWRKNRGSYNPYLHKKNKNKESVRIAKGNKKETRRARKEYKKELRRQERKRERKEF